MDGGSLAARPFVEFVINKQGVILAIEGKSPADLVQLAQAGALIEVDGRRYSVSDLVAIARALRPEGQLIIINAEGKSTNDLVMVVSAAPGKVHLG